MYRTLPMVLRGLPTWSHYVLTSHPKFEDLVGQQADRRRKLYNGRIACTYFQFHGPKPHSQTPRKRTDEERKPVFGGLSSKAKEQVELFRSRLSKRARHLRRWPTKFGITCYRLYERDIPEIPLVVDRYEDNLHLAEFERPHERTPTEHADWLDWMTRTAGEVLGVSEENIFMKRRAPQEGLSQYERFGAQNALRIVSEGGLQFQVNLSDYLDTGLFLDHRNARTMFRDAASDRRVLNLFGYTGAFSVYAAAGGARSTTTVDLSATYLDWAAKNMNLNDFRDPCHQRVRADALSFLQEHASGEHYDLAIVDAPTYSNSKRTEEDWDVQRDHVNLLARVAELMPSGGEVYFSTHSRRFKLADSIAGFAEVREISKKTVPADFRNRRIHRCWRMIRG